MQEEKRAQLEFHSVMNMRLAAGQQPSSAGRRKAGTTGGKDGTKVVVMPSASEAQQVYRACISTLCIMRK